MAGSGGRQQRYVRRYQELSKHVKELGLLERRYGYYWVRMVATVLAVAALGAGLVLVGDSWLQLLLAPALGLAFGQLAFLGHDAEHRQIFRASRANEWAALIHGTLLAGLSAGWWQTKHSRHHANPNKQGDDPDVASGAIAFTPDAFHERGRLAGFLAARQGWFFFPLLLLEGINLYRKSIHRAMMRPSLRRRWWELAFLAVRHGGYVSAVLLVMAPGKAVAFLAVQVAVFGFYMGGAFAPNHIGMPIVRATMKMDFLRRQVLMSRDLTGGRFVDFVFGGLNHQVEHHLFPSMPRPNLRRVRPLVREFCRRQQIPHTEKGVLTAYRDVLSYLNNVTTAARDPFDCPLAAQLRAPSA
jgi:fatty acid desaturase